MKNIVVCFPLLFAFILLQARQPVRYDVIIHEIMVNPPSLSPDLPNGKYVELYNTSDQEYDLYGWKLSDENNTAVIGAHFILKPAHFVVISSHSNAKLFADTVPIIGVSRFPVLRVNEDLIILLTDEDQLMHAVQYNRSWYQNEVKAVVGWSLEMIDARNPCGGAVNWIASIHPSGGTPGLPNSVQGNRRDNDEPLLQRTYAADPLHLTLFFDEPIDSQTAVRRENYLFSDGITLQQIIPQPPLYNTLVIKLDKGLEQNKVYTLEVKHLSDCSGNIMSQPVTVRAGWGQLPEEGNLVINEIMFNPAPDGADYVEIYNISSYIFNARDLFVANRTPGGNLSSIKQISATDSPIFPGDFLVVTENAAAIQRQFLVNNPKALIEMADMPSFPNTSGTVVLLNTQGSVIDEVNYSEKWHLKSIVNPKGIALERIGYHLPSQDGNSWHSASSSSGYGTPAYQNSQYQSGMNLRGEIALSPDIFSPDNDGRDDFLLISYQFPEPGYVCNITVFDAYGRTVRFLVRNGICGTNGYFRWDGLDEKNVPAGTGIYIVLTEVYNLGGNTKKFRQVVTLARIQ